MPWEEAKGYDEKEWAGVGGRVCRGWKGDKCWWVGCGNSGVTREGRVVKVV